MSTTAPIKAKLAELQTARAQAQADRQRLALMLATAEADKAPDIDRRLSEVEAELQLYDRDAARLHAAQRAAEAADAAETVEVIEARLVAGVKQATDPSILDAAKALDKALAKLQDAAQVFIEAGAARRAGVSLAGRALADLVPDARSNVNDGVQAVAHLADASGAQPFVLAALDAVLSTLGLRGRLEYTAPAGTLLDNVQRAHDDLAERLAGWTSANLRALCAPKEQ
ncbi:hypothetical protein [Rubrivivax gelatinosus]|uniref:Uncharacterized protein n=1 Tax=Rubrivivax gelatinosus TaxID=28068 RepID=A0ABS1DX49_RUBGE|nr:hypothetical protein [Rubrivivax gelatinosus]MBK1714639.1 hypothetical protein [Rubrivivax gelatinosus]